MNALGKIIAVAVPLALGVTLAAEPALCVDRQREPFGESAGVPNFPK